jgi:hypothetical protein
MTSNSTYSFIWEFIVILGRVDCHQTSCEKTDVNIKGKDTEKNGSRWLWKTDYENNISKFPTSLRKKLYLVKYVFRTLFTTLQKEMSC